MAIRSHNPLCQNCQKHRRLKYSIPLAEFGGPHGERAQICAECWQLYINEPDKLRLQMRMSGT